MENNQNPTEETFVSQPPAENAALSVGKPQENENIIAGIVGAFLFSLIGVLLWFIIY